MYLPYLWSGHNVLRKLGTTMGIQSSLERRRCSFRWIGYQRNRLAVLLDLLSEWKAQVQVQSTNLLSIRRVP